MQVGVDGLDLFVEVLCSEVDEFVFGVSDVEESFGHVHGFVEDVAVGSVWVLRVRGRLVPCRRMKMWCRR